MIDTKINNIRLISVTFKIMVTFAAFLLVSNFSSNYVNLILNRTALHDLMRQLIVKDLRDYYGYCNNQHKIFEFDQDLEGSVKQMEKKGRYELKNAKAIFLGVRSNGNILIHASHLQKKPKSFLDIPALDKIQADLKNGKDEGQLYFKFNREDYFAIYKFNPNWDLFLLRGEELNEFYRDSRKNFQLISYIIIGITLLCTVLGIFFLKFTLRYVKIITNSITQMIQSQELTIIDLKKAPRDDITYLGIAFNSVSSIINDLIHIFQKFTNKDIVAKAYQDHEVKLEGKTLELSILFTDIKRFTRITETLDHDIIKLLNLHYKDAIQKVSNHDGIIGAIIGDALLAVYGVLDSSEENKSLKAVLSAHEIHHAAKKLRTQMGSIRDDIVSEYGSLTKEQEKVYQAVCLDVGVGIDGGEVFYGTLGSYERMTSTVIGDNVNAASRLEGLTRVYGVPVICSEYIKNEIETGAPDNDILFVEIDTVQVKGKTIGKKIYWPILGTEQTQELNHALILFREGLDLYYKGDWRAAHTLFDQCPMDLSEIFKTRTSTPCPPDWDGIWKMVSK